MKEKDNLTDLVEETAENNGESDDSELNDNQVYGNEGEIVDLDAKPTNRKISIKKLNKMLKNLLNK